MAKKDKADLSDKKARILSLRDHYKLAVEADRENRACFVEDLKFVHVPEEQWLKIEKEERGEDRLRLQFNRTRVTIKSVINQMRANPGAIKIRGNEDGDKDTADILEGLIRNICNTSNWDAIRDNAAEYQVAGGYAAWRITTDYSDDSAFDQDIKIEGLKNPLCLYCDPSASDLTGGDAAWWVYTDKISKASFKQRFPDAEAVSFDDDVEFDDDEDWEDDERVRIAEHWWRKAVTKTIFLLDDGKTIDESELDDAKTAGRAIVKQRPCQSYEIWTAIYSGDAELTTPTKWAGKYFPWVRIYGEYVVIAGKVHWFGLTRHMKDPQRAHNSTLTAATEAVLSAPVNQNQVWATAKQAEGLAPHWTDAVKRNLPFQVYNHDPLQPGPPQRLPPPNMPVAQVQFSQIMSEELKADSGIYDASLGAQSNETSGRAIIARTQQGQIATFNYQANMANGERRMGAILVDLIPKIYDSTRSMRILGADDSERYIKVNEVAPDGSTVNDLSRGKYDVVVSVGPNFATKRQESAETLTALAQGNPALMQVAGDLMFKAMDVPYADEMADRMKMMLPAPIQESLNKDKPVPPDVMQARMQIEQAKMQVQQHGQMVQAAAQEAMQEKADAEKAKSDVQIQIANLKTEEARLQTMKSDYLLLVEKAKSEIAQMVNDQQNEAQQSQITKEAELASQAIIETANNVMAAVQQKEIDLSNKIDGLIARLMNPDQMVQ